MKTSKNRGTYYSPFTTGTFPVDFLSISCVCNKNVLIETPLRRLDNAKNPLFPVQYDLV